MGQKNEIEKETDSEKREKTTISVICVFSCILLIATLIIYSIHKIENPGSVFMTSYLPDDPDPPASQSDTVQTGGGTSTESPGTEDGNTDVPGTVRDPGKTSGNAEINTDEPCVSDEISAEKTDSPLTSEIIIVTQNNGDDTGEPIITTNAPVTDEVTTGPVSSVPPVTSKPPVTASPGTSARPPQTTKKPPVTVSPTTRPVTTGTPETDPPQTTSAPKETEPEIITPAYTTSPLSPETTAGQSIDKPVLDYGEEMETVLIAPNGDLVEGYWIRDGMGTHFVVKEPEFEYGTTVDWWNYSIYKNEFVWGTWYYISKQNKSFKSDKNQSGLISVEERTGIIHTEQEYTAPPGTWW